MIKLAFLDYKENIDLDILITEYANDNLTDIIAFALDYISDSSDIESFLPMRISAQSPDKCLLYIRELQTFSQDFVLHKDLSPIYQYILYRILTWYIDVTVDAEKDDLAFNDSLVIFEMDDSLKEKVTEKYGYSAVNRFSNIKNYLCEFFEDWDFHPDFLANVVQLCLNKSPLFYNFTSIEELENYVELMDGDTLRKYQFICDRKEAECTQNKRHLKTFNEILKNALSTIQKNSAYWDYDENRLNDVLCGLLRMIYDVHDQSRQGLSLSRKNSGEIDFLVFDDQEPVAIMEALRLDCLDRKELNDHLTKLLVNYDPQGYLRAYLIMYVTKQDFGKFWSDFCEYISTYSFQYPIKDNLTEIQSPYSEFRSAHMGLLRSGIPVILSFYAIHFPKKEGKQ